MFPIYIFVLENKGKFEGVLLLLGSWPLHEILGNLWKSRNSTPPIPKSITIPPSPIFDHFQRLSAHPTATKSLGNEIYPLPPQT